MSQPHRTDAAAQVLDVQPEDLPKALCAFAGMRPAETPEALALVREVLDAVDHAACAGMAGWMLDHIARDWPEPPSPAAPLADGVLELGDRLAACVTARTPAELSAVAAGLGTPRHHIARGVATALDTLAAQERWLEMQTGAPARPLRVWDGTAEALEWNLRDDHIEDLTTALAATEPEQWQQAQQRGVESAVLGAMCTLAGHVLDLAQGPRPPRMDWHHEDGENEGLVARVNVPGGLETLMVRVHPVEAQARVRPFSSGEQRDISEVAPLWPGSSLDLRLWAWEVAWPAPDGELVNYEAQQGSSREAGCWAAGQIVTRILQSPAEVRQPLTNRLLVPRSPSAPGPVEVVDLRMVLEAVYATCASDLDPRHTPDEATQWPMLPHCDSDGLVSLPGNLMDHLGLPWPHTHEKVAQLPVDHPEFATHLASHGFTLTPAAWAYFTGLAAPGDDPLPLRTRHEAAMTAVLALPTTDTAHLTAELGPLPAGMHWAQLLIPFRLKDFLYPTDYEDGESPDDELPPGDGVP
ncbi:hypothetical protein RCO28_34700 [Streptomyces sp. LHD-70]|uniref:hypothetical protein n=1 Tax=Streptomyces sp. LHD-70 TaxID=3072140 RepID=UPI00280C8CE8|nr:hypothetical protein [Streptomyces sp. LHD-70]MDQ8707584.1 hypothetical protein [Streptomyces sp. LHD-70]